MLWSKVFQQCRNLLFIERKYAASGNYSFERPTPKEKQRNRMKYQTGSKVEKASDYIRPAGVE